MMQYSSRPDAQSGRSLIQAALLFGVLATGICLGAVSVRAYDTRLDEALAALQKAAALVEASSAEDVSPRTLRKFDNQRRRALDDIQSAMDHIIGAGTTADSDGGSQ
jgi:hypothetical protein